MPPGAPRGHRGAPLNRRSFLVTLGLAATAAAATAFIDDPERLLWTPGAKTIVDLGAVKPLVPATDVEVTRSFTQQLLASSAITSAERTQVARDARKMARDIRLDINSATGVKSFRFKGDQLVSVHTPEDLQLLEKPFFAPEWKRP